MRDGGPSDADELAVLLRRACVRLGKVAGLPMAFGGPMDPDTGIFTISELYGTLTDSLRDLPAPVRGLGELVAARGVPMLLADYFGAATITPSLRHRGVAGAVAFGAGGAGCGARLGSVSEVGCWVG